MWALSHNHAERQCVSIPYIKRASDLFCNWFCFAVFIYFSVLCFGFVLGTLLYGLKNVGVSWSFASCKNLGTEELWMEEGFNRRYNYPFDLKEGFLDWRVVSFCRLRDGNLHPVRKYPLRPAPNGVGLTRSTVIMEREWGMF